MNSALPLAFLSLALPLSVAHGAFSYENLDHLDSGYRAMIDATNRNIGYANFQGTNSSNVNFMVTLFFDIETVLNTNTMEYFLGPENVPGSTEYSTYSGPFGLYVFNMDIGAQQLTRYFTATTSPFSGLTFSEIDQNDHSGLYQDQIDAYVNTSNFNYWDGNGSTSIDTTSTFNTALGNTIRTAGFPFSLPAPDFAGFAYSPTGQSHLPDAINGNIHSVGLIAVPEPSGVLLLGVAGVFGLAKRRRA